MSDPLTTLALVGNVVQFIDFGCKLVSKTAELAQSAEGVLKENADLEVTTTDSISISNGLRSTGAPLLWTQLLTISVVVAWKLRLTSSLLWQK